MGLAPDTSAPNLLYKSARQMLAALCNAEDELIRARNAYAPLLACDAVEALDFEKFTPDMENQNRSLKWCTDQTQLMYTHIKNALSLDVPGDALARCYMTLTETKAPVEDVKSKLLELVQYRSLH